MVAGLFAAFAVAATGVAVLRHKADLERPISHLGVEGIAGISVSSTSKLSGGFGLIFNSYLSAEPSHFPFLSSFWPILLWRSSLPLLFILSVAR